MKKIVWDWNGTLFNDINLCFDCINRLLTNHGLSSLANVNVYRNVFQFPIETYYKKAGFDFNQVSFKVLAQEYMNDYQSKSYSCQLFDDVISTLQTADERGLEQVILSASRKDFLQSQIELFPIQRYIDSIWGIDNIYAKSKVQLANVLKEQYPEDQFWFVGDSVHDYQVAASINARCVLVSCGHQARHRLISTHQPVFDKVSEALEYIYEAN